MTPAWLPSPTRAMGSFVILILRIIITAMGASPVTMAVRAAADGAVLVLGVVDDDLGRTACSCC